MRPFQSYSYYESPYTERRPLIAPSQGLGYHTPFYHSMVTTQPIPDPSIANGPAFPPGVQPHRNPFALQRTRASPDESEEDGINCSPCCDDENVSRTFRSIALGQVLSLCLCGTGISSQLLSNRGVNAPAAQSFTNYFLLCFVYCTALSCKTGDEGLLGVMRRRGLQYFILALIDVEANYMIVYAYQFTNLTSVQLLDCSTIPMSNGIPRYGRIVRITDIRCTTSRPGAQEFGTNGVERYHDWKTSALMFNLATLTADFYSLLFGLFLFKDSFHYLYFVSFVVVVTGSIIYSIKETQIRDPNEPRRVSPAPIVEPLTSIAMYAGQTNPRDCPVHGRRAAASSTLSNGTRISESRQ
ncbi:hypothetical protein GCK32_011672 [Trichostrongylus colubriformis]|uniref:Uncharacterized protein n=1 Tax=Trichostrongylus colubriformis TaxID=6319 RepID=A0AAN8IJ91_TRICO